MSCERDDKEVIESRAIGGVLKKLAREWASKSIEFREGAREALADALLRHSRWLPDQTTMNVPESGRFNIKLPEGKSSWL